MGKSSSRVYSSLPFRVERFTSSAIRPLAAFKHLAGIKLAQFLNAFGRLQNPLDDFRPPLRKSLA